MPKWFPGFQYCLETQTPEKAALQFYECYPPLLPARIAYEPLFSFYSHVPFSLEFWRESVDEPVRIVIGVPSRSALKPLEQAYPGVQFHPLDGKAEPSFVKGLEQPPVFFSAEQAHALPFVSFEPDYGAFVNRLTAALEGPCWVQIVWCLQDWAYLAEQAAIRFEAWIQAVEEGAMVVAPDVSVLSKAVLGHISVPRLSVEREESPLKASTAYQVGRKIAQEYFAKAQSTPVTLHVRGLLVPGYAYHTFDSAFSSIRIHWDTLVDYPLRDPRVLKWLRARAVPDITEQLRWHSEGGFLCEWGKGRELIAALCLTPEELPVFAALPSDPSLPIRYTRAVAVPGAGETEEEGLALWR